jgi:type IV secretion system protein VirB9
VSLALAASPAAAQVKPQPGPGDARLQTIDYRDDQVVLLEVAPGYQMTVELAPEEQIENVAVGDSAAWQLTANRRGDRLFIKPLQPGSTTNMTVITNQRIYAMQLATLYGPTPDMAFTVRFNYPSNQDQLNAGADGNIVGRYRVSGPRAIRPATIGDDGYRTYIQWAENQAIPAVFAEDSTGKEILVTGYMRDGAFVLDTVMPKLIFRIDRLTAQASRLRRTTAR